MKKIIHITWMHCISCEMILEKAFKDINSIDIISINHKKWILELDIKSNDDYKKVLKIINDNNFEIIEKSIETNKSLKLEKILKNIAVYLWLVVFIYIFSLIDLYKYLPDTPNLNYWWAFLMWIIASLSTCLAITWWIIIWFSKYIDESKGVIAHIRVQLLFQIWRILWFFILGWILWQIGSILSISFWFTSIFTFLIWFLFLYMWLNTVWILPSLTKFWFHLPKSFANKIEKFKNPLFAPIIWAMTFFLPCGFTQTLQVIAIWSGGFMTWAMIMAIFAIWTSPVLFSVWIWSSYFRENKFWFLNKIMWIILILFGIFTISNAYNLLSVPSKNIEQIEIIEEENMQEEIKQEVDESFEVIEVSHNWWATEPEKIELKAWWNYKIVITPSSNGRWCMSTVVSPKLSREVYDVIKWEPIIYDIKNAKPWSYPLVCSAMWMKQWVIIVK